MNEALDTVTSDNSNTFIDLGYEKNFHIGLSDYDNGSLYIRIATTLSEESAILMITDEDAFDHISKNPQQYDRSHCCAHRPATYT